MVYGYGRGYGRDYVIYADRDVFGCGPGGKCICPKCGHSIPHVTGEPCTSKACPKCGTLMMRKSE